MAPTIGYPYDPYKLAREKEAALKDALNTRGKAWDAYIDVLSLAYDKAYTLHTGTLGKIKERIRNQVDLAQSLLFGAVFPSALGGGMSVLVSSATKEMTNGLLALAKNNRKELVDLAAGVSSSVSKDVSKLAATEALKGLKPNFGDEWSSVADTPLRFFLKLKQTIDAYATSVVNDLEMMKRRTSDASRKPGSGTSVDEYIDTLNGYLLSPFIQKAPMQKDFLYGETDLAPVFEVFMWVVWARTRDVSYWATQVSRAMEEDDRSTIGKIWDAAWNDEDTENRAFAELRLADLDPILARLVDCGITAAEVTDAFGSHPDRRFLNIFWLRVLGQKHARSFLGDLTSNLDAKQPKSFFEGGYLSRSLALL